MIDNFQARNSRPSILKTFNMITEEEEAWLGEEPQLLPQSQQAVSELLRIGENLVRVGKELICAEPWRGTALYTIKGQTNHNLASYYICVPARRTSPSRPSARPMCIVLRNAYLELAS